MNATICKAGRYSRRDAIHELDVSEHDYQKAAKAGGAAAARYAKPTIKNADPNKLTVRAPGAKPAPKRSVLDAAGSPAAATRPGTDREQAGRELLIRTSLLAAQCAVDAASSQLSAARAGANGGVRTLELAVNTNAALAERFLEEALAAASAAGSRVDGAKLAAQADATSRALTVLEDHVNNARFVLGPHIQPLDSLVATNERLRLVVGLPEVAPSGPRNTTGRNDAGYPPAAVGPALDALATNTSTALTFLDQTATHDQLLRTQIVERVAADVQFTSEYVTKLLEPLQPGERQRSGRNASEAARVVGKLLRWVRTRPAREQLEAKLIGGIEAFDRALTAMGTPRIADRDEVALSEGQRHAAETEHAETDRAYDDTGVAIDALAARQRSKIALLRGIAALDDLPEPPPFLVNLLSAVLDTTLSHSLSQFAKMLGTPALASPAVTLPKAGQTIGLPSSAKSPRNFGIGTPAAESVFAVGSGTLKSAVAKQLAAPRPSGVDPTKLALHYFCSALTEAETDRRKTYLENLHALRARGALTVHQLHDMQRVVDRQAGSLLGGYFQQITTAWAQYLAQSRLGTTTLGGQKVSKMGDYFGDQRPGGRLLVTSRAGRAGVLAIVLRLEPGAAKPALDASATRIIGLNSELMRYVLAGADHELDNVELPKEVHVRAEFARATIALDEHNRIRDVLNWDELRRYVGDLTPQRFWQLWGQGLKVS